jgi:hypothetical protein
MHLQPGILQGRDDAGAVLDVAGLDTLGQEGGDELARVFLQGEACAEIGGADQRRVPWL